MRNTLQLLSLILFGFLSLFLIWFGWLYASVDKVLWFHAAAVPAAALDAVRPLYFALMNLIGGSSLGLGFLCLCATATLLRKGSIVCATAVSVAIAIPLATAAITAEELAKTGAPTSWHIMGVLLIATVMAWVSHLAAFRVKIS